MVLSRPPTSIKIISKSENFLISLFIVGVVIDIAVISSFSLNARKAKLLACLPSPSIINTFLLSCAAATAKLQVKVDFPTPPLVFTILIRMLLENYFIITLIVVFCMDGLIL